MDFHSSPPKILPSNFIDTVWKYTILIHRNTYIKLCKKIQPNSSESPSSINSSIIEYTTDDWDKETHAGSIYYNTMDLYRKLFKDLPNKKYWDKVF